MPLLGPPGSLFRALSGALERLHVRWYVFGAQAVLVWGRPRLTADIDVTVHLVPPDSARLVEELRLAGFTLRVEGTTAFIEQTRVLPLLHGESQWPLDLVLGGPGLEEAFLDRAVQVEIEPGLRVPVLCAEDLIVTKILAGRPKDLEDVRGILSERAALLDADAIRTVLSMLETALGVSDLLPVFEAEWAIVSRG